MKLVVLLLACLGVCFTEQTVLTSAYRQDTSLQNLWAPTEYLTEESSHFVIDCAIKCNFQNNCASFFYSAISKLCQIHSGVFVEPTGLTAAPADSRYYLDILVNLTATTTPPAAATTTAPTSTTVQATTTTTVAATTTPVVVPVGMTCPPEPPMTASHSVNFSDGSVYQYRIEVGATYTQAGAMNFCQGLGMTLIKPITLAKQQTLEHVFLNCVGSYQFSGPYWIDGSNAAAGDFFDITQWKTDGGVPLPITNDFWGANEPNSPSTSHCAALAVGIQFKWEATPCDWSYYAVCEAV